MHQHLQGVRLPLRAMHCAPGLIAEDAPYVDDLMTMSAFTEWPQHLQVGATAAVTVSALPDLRYATLGRVINPAAKKLVMQPCNDAMAQAPFN